MANKSNALLEVMMHLARDSAKVMQTTDVASIEEFKKGAQSVHQIIKTTDIVNKNINLS